MFTCAPCLLPPWAGTGIVFGLCGLSTGGVGALIVAELTAQNDRNSSLARFLPALRGAAGKNDGSLKGLEGLEAAVASLANNTGAWGGCCRNGRMRLVVSAGDMQHEPTLAAAPTATAHY